MPSTLTFHGRTTFQKPTTALKYASYVNDDQPAYMQLLHVRQCRLHMLIFLFSGWSVSAGCYRGAQSFKTIDKQITLCHASFNNALRILSLKIDPLLLILIGLLAKVT